MTDQDISRKNYNYHLQKSWRVQDQANQETDPVKRARLEYKSEAHADHAIRWFRIHESKK